MSDDLVEQLRYSESTSARENVIDHIVEEVRSDNAYELEEWGRVGLFETLIEVIITSSVSTTEDLRQSFALSPRRSSVLSKGSEAAVNITSSFIDSCKDLLSALSSLPCDPQHENIVPEIMSQLIQSALLAGDERLAGGETVTIAPPSSHPWLLLTLAAALENASAELLGDALQFLVSYIATKGSSQLPAGAPHWDPTQNPAKGRVHTAGLLSLAQRHQGEKGEGGAEARNRTRGHSISNSVPLSSLRPFPAVPKLSLPAQGSGSETNPAKRPSIDVNQNPIGNSLMLAAMSRMMTSTPREKGGKTKELPALAAMITCGHKVGQLYATIDAKMLLNMKKDFEALNSAAAAADAISGQNSGGPFQTENTPSAAFSPHSGSGGGGSGSGGMQFNPVKIGDDEAAADTEIIVTPPVAVSEEPFAFAITKVDTLYTIAVNELDAEETTSDPVRRASRVAIAMIKYLLSRAWSYRAHEHLSGELVATIGRHDADFAALLLATLQLSAHQQEARLFRRFRQPTTMVGYPVEAFAQPGLVPEDALLRQWAIVGTYMLEIHPTPWEDLTWHLAMLAHYLEPFRGGSSSIPLQAASLCLSVVVDAADAIRSQAAFRIPFAIPLHYIIEIFDIMLAVPRPPAVLVKVMQKLLMSTHKNPLEQTIRSYARRLLLADDPFAMFDLRRPQETKVFETVRVSSTLFWPNIFDVQKHLLRLVMHYRMIAEVMATKPYLADPVDPANHPLEFLLNPIDGCALHSLSTAVTSINHQLQYEFLRLIATAASDTKTSILMQNPQWISTYVRFLYLSFLQTYNSQSFIEEEPMCVEETVLTLRAIGAIVANDDNARRKADQLGVISTLVTEVDLEQSVSEMRERHIRRSTVAFETAGRTSDAFSQSGLRRFSVMSAASPRSPNDRSLAMSPKNSTAAQAVPSLQLGKGALSSSSKLKGDTEFGALENSQASMSHSQAAPDGGFNGLPRIPISQYVLPAAASASPHDLERQGQGSGRSHTNEESSSPIIGDENTSFRPSVTPSTNLSANPSINPSMTASPVVPVRPDVATRTPTPAGGPPKGISLAIPKLSLGSAPPPLYYTSNGDTGGAADAGMSAPTPLVSPAMTPLHSTQTDPKPPRAISPTTSPQAGARKIAKQRGFPISRRSETPTNANAPKKGIQSAASPREDDPLVQPPSSANSLSLVPSLQPEYVASHQPGQGSSRSHSDSQPLRKDASGGASSPRDDGFDNSIVEPLPGMPQDESEMKLPPPILDSPNTSMVGDATAGDVSEVEADGSRTTYPYALGRSGNLGRNSSFSAALNESTGSRPSAQVTPTSTSVIPPNQGLATQLSPTNSLRLANDTPMQSALKSPTNLRAPSVRSPTFVESHEHPRDGAASSRSENPGEEESGPFSSARASPMGPDIPMSPPGGFAGGPRMGKRDSLAVPQVFHRTNSGASGGGTSSRTDSVNSANPLEKTARSMEASFAVDRGLYPMPLLQDATRFVAHQRSMRRVYISTEVQAEILFLILLLLVRPEGMLDEMLIDSYTFNSKKINILFYLHMHLNSDGNRFALDRLRARVREDTMNTGIHVLLYLLVARPQLQNLYEGGSRLGSGAYGVVCAARVAVADPVADADDRCPLAIKYIPIPRHIDDRSAVVSLHSEVMALLLLQEKAGVCSLIDLGNDGQHYYVVMRRYRTSVSKWREQFGVGCRKEQRAWFCALFLHMLDLVSAVHMQGIVHYDIKCDNFFLDLEGSGADGILIPHIGDFGESEVLIKRDGALMTSAYRSSNRSSRNPNNNQEQSRASRGTEVIRSPEMLLPHKFKDRRRRMHEAGFQSDVWSVGCLLFELLTGRHLFNEEHYMKLVHRVTSEDGEILEEDHKMLLDNDAEIISFLQFVLCRDPQRRPLMSEVRSHFVKMCEEKDIPLKLPPANTLQKSNNQSELSSSRSRLNALKDSQERGFIGVVDPQEVEYAVADWKTSLRDATNKKEDADSIGPLAHCTPHVVFSKKPPTVAALYNVGATHVLAFGPLPQAPAHVHVISAAKHMAAATTPEGVEALGKFLCGPCSEFVSQAVMNNGLCLIPSFVCGGVDMAVVMMLLYHAAVHGTHILTAFTHVSMSVAMDPLEVNPQSCLIAASELLAAMTDDARAELALSPMGADSPLRRESMSGSIPSQENQRPASKPAVPKLSLGDSPGSNSNHGIHPASTSQPVPETYRCLCSHCVYDVGAPEDSIRRTQIQYNRRQNMVSPPYVVSPDVVKNMLLRNTLLHGSKVVEAVMPDDTLSLGTINNLPPEWNPSVPLNRRSTPQGAKSGPTVQLVRTPRVGWSCPLCGYITHFESMVSSNTVHVNCSLPTVSAECWLAPRTLADGRSTSSHMTEMWRFPDLRTAAWGAQRLFRPIEPQVRQPVSAKR